MELFDFEDLFGFKFDLQAPINWRTWDWNQTLITNMDSFRWVHGETPLSDLNVLFVTWICYWSTILTLKFLMSFKTEGFKLKAIAAAHNMFLCIWSLVMFVGLCFALKRQHDNFGIRSLFCAANKEQVDPAMFYCLYIFYVSKFYELFDTVILVLKKKPLIFLHWYHHTIVLAMTWSWLHFEMNFACLGMLANTAVHVAMYYYYFAATLGMKVWYKKYITTMQLVQFSASFILSIIFKLYSMDGGVCIGNQFGIFEFSLAVNITFFFLFARFYQQNYKSKLKDNEKKKE